MFPGPVRNGSHHVEEIEVLMRLELEINMKVLTLDLEISIKVLTLD